MGIWSFLMVESFNICYNNRVKEAYAIYTRVPMGGVFL